MLKHLLRELMVLFVITLLVIPVQVALADLSVTITSPADGNSFRVGSNIILTAVPTLTSGTLKEVRFYNGTIYIGKATGDPLSFTWKNVKSGNYNVFARVRDMDLNQADSDTIKIHVGNISRGDVVRNGDMDGTITPWALQNSNGSASTATIFQDMYFEDSSYVYFNITNGGTETWHIQFYEAIPLEPDHTFEISFLADAEQKKAISIAMQQNQDPWAVYFQQDIEIDGAGEYGPYTFINTYTDPTNVFKFNIGLNTIPMFLDRIRIIDRSLTSVSSHDLLPNKGTAVEYELFHSYPNPFNMNTNIQYRLSKSANVALNVYNMQGQLVKTLLDGIVSAGQYTAKWDGTDNSNVVLPSGVYVYRMEIPAEKVQLTSKVLLLK